MQAAAKIGIGLGAASAVGTIALGRVMYEDSAHDRNNDRNALLNMGAWIATPVVGGAALVARKVLPQATPWLFGATAVLGANAFVGAATLENGWERAGVAYCNYGFCNRTAGERYDAPSIWVDQPNPMEDR